MNSVGIDISKGRSTVAVMRPFAIQSDGSRCVKNKSCLDALILWENGFAVNDHFILWRIYLYKTIVRFGLFPSNMI